MQRATAGWLPVSPYRISNIEQGISSDEGNGHDWRVNREWTLVFAPWQTTRGTSVCLGVGSLPLGMLARVASIPCSSPFGASCAQILRNPEPPKRLCGTASGRKLVRKISQLANKRTDVALDLLASDQWHPCRDRWPLTRSRRPQTLLCWFGFSCR